MKKITAFKILALSLMVLPFTSCAGKNTYTITFKNYDGSVLKTISVNENETPSYGENPTRRSDESYDYTFSAWNPGITAAKSNATYTAVYSGKPTKIDNLRKALLYVGRKKNYTFTYDQMYLVPHQIIFTEKSLGIVSEEYPEVDKVYYQDGSKGVFSIGFNGKHFVSSEYYTQSTYIWSNEFNYTMLNVSLDYIDSIEDDVNEMVIKDKPYRIAFLRTVGYAASDILDMGDLNVSFNNEKGIPSLTYTFTLSGTDFTYIVDNFGTSVNKMADDFINAGGKVFTPNATLSRMRTLLKTNNFMSRNYYYDGSVGVYNSTSYFHPHYYYTVYDDTTYASGYIGLRKDSENVNGCYSFSMELPNGRPQILTVPLYNNNNIVQFVHYPTLLELLKHLEYAHEWDNEIISKFDYRTLGETYMVTDTSLLNNFANNFSLDSGFKRSTPIALGIDYIEHDIKTGETIMFVYKFYWNKAEFTIQIPIYGFNTVSNKTLDDIVKEYSL